MNPNGHHLLHYGEPPAFRLDLRTKPVVRTRSKQLSSR